MVQFPVLLFSFCVLGQKAYWISFAIPRVSVNLRCRGFSAFLLSNTEFPLWNYALLASSESHRHFIDIIKASIGEYCSALAGILRDGEKDMGILRSKRARTEKCEHLQELHINRASNHYGKHVQWIFCLIVTGSQSSCFDAKVILKILFQTGCRRTTRIQSVNPQLRGRKFYRSIALSTKLSQ